MNKIGIKITKISSGVQELETFNGGEWTRKVSDIRTDLKSVKGNALDDGVPVLMVSFTRDGSIVTVCHAIPGRAGDLVSAWIFFPVEISISAEEEYAIIERVKEEIAKPNVESWDAMGQLCAKEYPLKQGYFNYKESVAANPCAVRYYGSGTDFGLRELLGDRLYQDYYTGHRYVFFLDASAGIIAEDRLVNYTNDPVREFVVLTPPQLPENVTVRLNDKDFSKPIFGLKGDKATLTFYRPGYSPVAFQIAQGGPMPDPNQLSWQRLVTPSLFYVTDDDNRDLNVSSRILIKGQRLTANGISIPEEECTEVQIEVECPGCERYSNVVNLQNPPIRLVLEREKVNVVYLIDGKECPGLTECPKGYEFSESRQGKKIIRNCYYKEPETGPNWKLIALIGSIAALVVGLALGLFLPKIMSKRGPAPTEEVVDKPNRQGETNNGKRNTGKNEREQVHPKVYDCLNQNIWKKAEIEKVPELQGFFSDFLKCDASALKKWAEKIDPEVHPQWKKLLNEINQSDPEILKDFNWDFKATEVEVDTYIKLLKNRATPKAQSGTAVGAIDTRNGTSDRRSTDHSAGGQTNANRQGSGSGNNGL